MRHRAPAPHPLARVIALALVVGSVPAPSFAAEVADGLRAKASRDGHADALIVLEARAPKQLLRNDGTYLERRRVLVDTLRATADVSQARCAHGSRHRGCPISRSGSST